MRKDICKQEGIQIQEESLWNKEMTWIMIMTIQNCVFFPVARLYAMVIRQRLSYSRLNVELINQPNS